MRFATYNLWNSDQGMPRRAFWQREALSRAAADVACLQEVPCAASAEALARALGYPHVHFAAYPGEEEGLAMLSRLPLTDCRVLYPKARAIYAVVVCQGQRVGVANLHLPWDSPLQRERETVALLDWLRAEACDQLLLMGDFNTSPRASVHGFLLGDCTLSGAEARPCFYDLAQSFAQHQGVEPEATLDFQRNPRFAGNTVEINGRFDRIYLRNPYPAPFPTLIRCDVFGREICPDNGLAASDHWGVMAELAFDAPHEQ